MGENVKVIVRCRPMNQKEIDSKYDVRYMTTNCYCILVFN